MQHFFELLFGLFWLISLLDMANSQRPLLNYTNPNAIFMTQQQQQQHNYLGNSKQLRNGRINDQSPPSPPLTNPFHDDDLVLTEEGQLRATLDAPTDGKWDSRRRPNFVGLLPEHVQRPERGGRGRGRGMDSLRKELMKPSMGGPGGGLSSSGAGYPSYPGTSSIGSIDGLGGLSPADRYGDLYQLRPERIPSTRFPPLFIPNQGDERPMRTIPRKSSNPISEILKLTNGAKQQRYQPLGLADEPVGGVTNSNLEDLEDPLQAIKEKMRITGPKSSPYESQTDSTPSSEIEDQLGVRCNFETTCAWEWTGGLPDGFHVMSGTELAKKNMTGMMPGPVADTKGDANGHFLYARLLPSTAQVNLTSPQFSTTMEKCYLEIYLHQSDMSHSPSRVVIEPLHSQESSWVPAEIVGDNFRAWSRKTYRIGRISRDFRIVFEIVPKLSESQRAHVAIDNLRMVSCFPEGTKSEKCSTSQVRCMNNRVPVCIPLPRICDITRDCDDAEDELLNCDKIPYGGRCDFENDWCGWHDSGKTILSWSRHTGSSPTHDTGPDGDHTYQHLLNSTGGYYMLVDMNQHINNSEKGSRIGFASNAIMISKTFNPPPLVHGNPNSPYRNSCVVRFYIHQFGKNPGSINLSVVEMKERENITTTLWWSTKNQGSDWLRAEYVLPNITSKYYMQFEARMGMRIFSDVAVDDFSLSPECFGLNIPKEHLNGYNYWNVRYKLPTSPHKDFEHKPYLELTTCNTGGMIGPTQHQCETAYKSRNSSHVLKEVRVIEEQSSYKGMQKWRVPHEGYYTIIVKGASGGLGSGGVGSSRGAMAMTILELHKNEEIYILVGQQGENACIKSISHKDENCGSQENDIDLSQYDFNYKRHLVKNMVIENGAGGGGGGSFVFLLNSAKNEAVPLVVAGGGGGLGIGRYIDEDFQHGQKANPSRPGITGQIHGEQVNKKTAGPGGGWRAKEDQALSPKYGAALLQGGRGGHSCYVEIMAENGSIKNMHGQGGFGGGGGGCNTGGGGGGYAGGDVYLNVSNGEGGTSYISNSRSLKEFSVIYEGASNGPGSVIIVPAIEGCGCDYRCIALDEYRATTRCICPEGWRLKRDNSTACEVIADEPIPFQYLIAFFMVLIVVLGAALSSLIFILYNRYQRKKQATLRHKMLLEQDLQLSRLRHNAGDVNMTNFNPNYGCDGILNGNIDVKSLPQVARESLRLVKALGQGAFGEVYQGLYRHRDGDAVEMAVAVKTLPEMSTKQAEDDFLMEAAIMAKFNHPNMVHLIGVCFDRHPRFIVLELLAGGDLKNFLREGRNKPDRPSSLTMKDLVFCALDVAKGCRYMESKRFIHRDIAARNCLLSSKGPGRVVKIADFGMARDIYRSDYYRKGGKAMLPIKWMPPEAFLDGIFTSKTDVWSFGVLLWEVFSMGLMPYTGLPNPEVMQLVTTGFRLSAPPGCPKAIYEIMAECWNPTPEERPSFTEILEKLTARTQDPEVMNAPLPSIFRPPSSERDQTIMRPASNDEFCLSVPQASDYLIPMPSPRSGVEFANVVRNNAPHSIRNVSDTRQPPSSGHDQATIRPASTEEFSLSAPHSSDYLIPMPSPHTNTNCISIVRNTAPLSTINVCSPPAISSPSAPNNSRHSGEEMAGCWETSFIMPNSHSDQPLLGSNHESQRNAEDKATQNKRSNPESNDNTNCRPQSPQQHNSVDSQSPPNGCLLKEKADGSRSVAVEAREAKLISLDTPQPTPTTLMPPVSFSSQLDGITLDPAALTKSLQQHNNNNSSTNAATAATAANKQSYANIQMINSEAPSEKKMNGSAQLSNGPTSNGAVSMNSSNSTLSANSMPFTIQGYSERFKDNHSEISC